MTGQTDFYAGKGLTMVEQSELAAELEVVKQLAVEAAAVAMARAGEVRTEEKANLSFVTDLDRDLEQMIRRRIAERFPDDQITGEEYGAEGGSGPRRWSIDPIDGTGNLVHGLPLWAISIGLIDQGEPVLGVIAIPPLRELYWAVKGQGAWRDGQRLQASDAATIHNQDNICIGTNALRAIDPRSVAGRLRDLGTACCEQVFVAASRLQACTFLGEATHDIAAGVVISSEAGCAFGTLKGERLSPTEMIRRTPIATPTFVAPPRRLATLMTLAHPLPSRSES
jgi:fructose-1,6-bisphosphatase/inositol monophosphatase family enzyme